MARAGASGGAAGRHPPAEPEIPARFPVFFDRADQEDHRAAFETFSLAASHYGRAAHAGAPDLAVRLLAPGARDVRGQEIGERSAARPGPLRSLAEHGIPRELAHRPEARRAGVGENRAGPE